jgi:oxygen-dependent protoporphyrinogen oxidase
LHALNRRVAVIGGGIAGLSAAFRLQQAGAQVTVFERSGHSGGRTRTRRDAGFVIDVGAGLLPSTYVDTKRLIVDAGLAHLAEAVSGSVAILRNGRQHSLEMQRPVISLITTSLLTWRSKLRLLRLAKALRAAYSTLRFDTTSGAAPFDTESIAAFVDRELNSEIRDHFIEPLMRTLYLHDAEDASIVELLWCLKNLSSNSSFALKGGMDSLASELAARFDVQYEVDVLSVEREGNGCRLTFATNSRPFEDFDAAVVATDAHDLLRIMHGAFSPEQRQFLEDVRYSASVNLHYCLRKPLATSDLIIQVPKSVDAALAALVQDHLKGSSRAPVGQGLVSAFFLSHWGEAMWDRSDAEITADAGRRIEGVIAGFLAQVDGVHVERWRRAATIGYPGYYRRLARFEAQIDARAPIQIASDVFAPSSVNVAVCQGERAAARLIARFQPVTASSLP